MATDRSPQDDLAPRWNWGRALPAPGRMSVDFETRVDFRRPLPNGRQSWNNYAEALYESPIFMRYEGLDRHAAYVVRATYSGRYRPTMTLTANEGIPVHGPVATEEPPVTREWPVPREATAGGRLTLTWRRVSGRGAQVAEVWLIRVTERADQRVSP